MLNATSTTAWNEEVHEAFLLANFPVVVQADSPEHTQALMAAKTPVDRSTSLCLDDLKTGAAEQRALIQQAILGYNRNDVRAAHALVRWAAETPKQLPRVN